MIRRKTKESHSSDASYESNFSDGELRAYGLTKVPGSVVQDTESLWDYRLPVALRLRKTTNSVGDRVRKSVAEPKERLDVRDVSSEKENKSTSVETRKVDKSQQTCLTNLTRRTTPKRRCRRPPNVQTAGPPPPPPSQQQRQQDRKTPRVSDVLPASRIAYAVNVLLDRAFETFADFHGNKRPSSRCCAIRVRVLDETIRLVRMLSRLLEDLRRADRDGQYVCRYDGLIDDYDACRKTYLKMKKYVCRAATCRASGRAISVRS